MRVVFIGTVEFSQAALDRLISLNADIVGIVTMASSTFHADFTDLSSTARQSGIPVLTIAQINRPSTVQWIAKRRPDIIYCFGFSQILKKEILQLAPMGVIGYHPAKLPRNRGRHPVIWPLVLGLNSTGSSFFFMDEGADSGDLLSQREVPVFDTDTARTLYDRITTIALEQITEFHPALCDGTHKRTPQDHSKANYLRKRSKADGRIDFRMNASAIYDLVRALTVPYPGAHISYQGKDIPVWEIQRETWSDPSVEPGKVLNVAGEQILVKCHDGAVLLTKHEFTEYPHAGDYFT